MQFSSHPCCYNEEHFYLYPWQTSYIFKGNVCRADSSKYLPNIRVEVCSYYFSESFQIG